MWPHGCSRGVACLRLVATLLIVVPLAGTMSCGKKETRAEAITRTNAVSMKPVSLYFEGPDLLLWSEVRQLPVPANDAAAVSVVVNELLKGSANTAVARPFPADATLRAAYLLPDGNAIIDLGGPTLSGGWNAGSHQEMMAVYAMVQTIASNFPQVRRVRLLINGEPAETLAGHIALSHPLAPLPALVRK